MHFFSRGTTEGFAKRVCKNLDFIIQARDQGADVHEVTQLVISLLGLIVFPWEAHALKELEAINLAKLHGEGWPDWDIQLDRAGDTKTLGKLIWHLRNAASHRRIQFSSDNRELSQVTIQFEDAPNPDVPANWRANISASQLKDFCHRFASELQAFVG